MTNMVPYAKTYILDYMCKIGVPLHMKGAIYLVDAIILYMSGTEKISAIYYQISKIYNADAKTVERNIRSCIKKAWECDKFNAFETLFGSKEKVSSPTNKEFICLMAHKLKLRLT